MSNILKDDEIKAAQAWLHDVFIWGGASGNPKRAQSIDQYRYMYGTHPDNFRTQDPTQAKDYRDAAQTICMNILHRQVETQRFQAFNDAIKKISQCYFIPDLNASRGVIKKEPIDLCAYIAWFCEANHLVYNNTNTSNEELAQCKKLLIFQVLWDNYLMSSGTNTPENNPANKKEEPVATDSKDAAEAKPQETTPTPPPAQAPQQPAAGNHKLFRNNCNGLVDPKGTKLSKISNDGLVYWIGGEFSNGNNKTKPKLHVSPLTKGTPNQNPLPVKYSTGQGEDDCILFFASEGAAKNFLGLAQANMPNTVASLEVKKVKEDTNGYVEVITNLGNAYIKAYKLREEVEEELKEDNQENNVSNKEVWAAFKHGFFSE